MLKLTDVTWLYEHLPMRFTLSVRQGERIAVLGPSGAGKSTLLNLIAGFLQPASGSIVIDNGEYTYAPPAKRPVSMLFQENNLFNHLTVWQNIALGMDPGLKLNVAQRQTLEAIAEQMGLAAFINRLPGELSAASASAWRWRAAWCASSRYCCSMNPFRRSTPLCVRKCSRWLRRFASANN